MKRRKRLVSRRATCAAQSLRVGGFSLAAIAVAMAAVCMGCEPASRTEAPLGSTDHSIVGGKPAQEKAYPWMVALFELYKSKPYFMCGGTLIDETHVLTAAHCSLSTRIDHEQHQFVTEATDPVQVVVARRPQSLTGLEDEDVLTVRSVIVHPLFGDMNTDYDVAIWELAEPVKLREYPRLMTNPAVMDWLSQLRLPARVIGYGARSADDEEGSDVLLQADVPLVSRAQCLERYAQFFPGAPPEELITERMICAGHRGGGKDACYGDSGGPLLLPATGKTPLLAGVVSWGAECGESGAPGVYANVAALADYISACQEGECETRAPQRDCDWGWEDCDGERENGCEKAPATPMACGPSCSSPACADSEACLIGDGFHCAPAKPVTPSARCVVKEPDEYGTYLAWFSLNNENQGNLQIPFSDQSFTDGAEAFITMDLLPPGFIEYASLLVLDRPDSGTYTVRGPDGQERSASVTADTPSCPQAEEPMEQQVTRLSHAPGRQVRDKARLRLRGLAPKSP